MASGRSGGLGGLVAAGVVVFAVVHGCAGTTTYHSHDTTVTNPDGSTTFTDNYDVGGTDGTFSCTTTSDYSSTDCTGNP